jgi:hypothetical protein
MVEMIKKATIGPSRWIMILYSKMETSGDGNFHRSVRGGEPPPDLLNHGPKIEGELSHRGPPPHLADLW